MKHVSCITGATPAFAAEDKLTRLCTPLKDALGKCETEPV